MSLPILPDFPDPAAYDISDFGVWPHILGKLEHRIARYAGAFGVVMAAHHMRVAADGLGFLMYLGYPIQACLNLKAALQIHDIGKTHDLYDPQIWSLPGRPTEDQRCEKRLHTRRGLDVLEALLTEHYPDALTHPHIDLCRNVILYHHERLNGSLYENRTDLPEWMQVVSIIDTYDGDRIHRPHQGERRSPQETIRRMMAEKGDDEKYDGAFSPELLEKFAAYKL
ncbi:MAG: hypothetical protein H6855_01790 [Rhodospirillales bacterium]|nr:hypothetical protein [Rhodospirillales bacterium]MCB9964796.1 hypothetical protein [Rhodospirillales bacterium]MCB9973845.1 hypothetical protein [Rhodospirillales bacterium]MCB9980498.1 hypothetical protein [Rhodospirillales bacterium]